MDSQQVTQHYNKESFQLRIEAALKQANLAEGTVDWTALAPMDQFHMRGLAATKELAESLGVEPGAQIIDVGCGLGGPARFLAATYDCHVTGIDLTQTFVDVAVMLTERCGLSDKAVFRQADALDLPFPDATFDLAWTQHVAMNIADRERLYASIHRVLKPGGRLGIYDVVAGAADAPLIFPVPWASTPEISFLLTPDAMRAVLEQTGFSVVSWTDKTEVSIEWLAAQPQPPAPPNPAANPLSLQAVMGPQFMDAVANLGRNLKEGRAGLVQAILRRD